MIARPEAERRMIPLRDNIPARTWPVVNYLLIATCTVVFFAQLAEPDDPQRPTLVERYGMIPARISRPGEPVEIPVAREFARGPDGSVLVGQDGRPVIREFVREAAPAAVPPLLTLLTCTFLHGGWLHFLGNMWFLFVFGDNVEDRLGKLAYLVFYLLGGVAASLAHYLSQPYSPVPTLGASGAIAAVMGAYMVLYPHARVLTLVPIVIFIQLLWLPAPLFLGIWFVIQLFQGVASISATAAEGVAWWAHAGGFAVGALGAWLMHRTHQDRPPVERLRPGSERIVSYQGMPYRVPRRY
jgi:membrane associated rhomboid family serine protease